MQRKVKKIKKLVFETEKKHGRGGRHQGQKDRPRKKQRTEDYLFELEEDLEE